MSRLAPVRWHRPVAAAAATPVMALALAAPAQALANDEECVTGAPEPAADPWQVRHLSLDEIAETWQGWDVRIAVVSSGVDGEHPGLHGHLAPGAAVGTDGSPLRDCLGLGTATAGAAAAAVAPGSEVPGVAPSALVVPVRVADSLAGPRDPSSPPDGSSAMLADGIEAAVAAEADVVVLPAVLTPDSTELRAAAAQAEEGGTLVVQGIPAGPLPEDLRFPVAYPEVVGVVGHDRDGLAAPETAAPELVDVVAPGVEVDVPVPGGYATVSHPDVAAAFVAGTAALMLDAEPELAPSQLRRRLLEPAGAPTAPATGAITAPLLSPAAVLGPPGPLSQPVDTASPAAPYQGAPANPAADTAGPMSLLVAVVAVVVLGAGALVAVTVRNGLARRWQAAGSARVPGDRPRTRTLPPLTPGRS